MAHGHGPLDWLCGAHRPMSRQMAVTHDTS